ncbi:hypothetical protein CCR80_09735 [Rhodothalassium salexigens]|uniref:proton-conducting transporter transmembrane domain-containing protein n=1 Tax=Rhodothalassium salexigens TaxID=1086 RepID=UPI001912A3CD|nr:proton-conducting transporter membrane subunit [Rhodothalassium salexigens]MBK5921308.1 hypothetical protein [Rhodothalassium salexigens]
MFASLAAFYPVAALLLALAAGVSLVDPGRRPRLALTAARVATLGALALSAVAGLGLIVGGPATGALIGVGGVGLSPRLDPLSAIMACLVSFVGVIVTEFSRNYMDGDARHGRFMGALCLTLAAVLLLVTAGNLWHLVAAWIATSLTLHRLLVFYADRPIAVVAARKKFLAARAGDAALILAALLLARAFGTADLAGIAEAASAAAAAGSAPWGVALAAGLIVIAAVLKSAQFPTHGWLLEVMETPTPVSALLHAGIVNAGGFLVVRFADVMVLSLGAMTVLALVGAVTALFGCVAMLTQPSVKVSLAYSTVAQMGFMLLQCGLGAFSAAVLHIVAHSLYKAHAFLSAGSVVETVRRSMPRPGPYGVHPAIFVAALTLSLGLFLVIATVAGLTPETEPAILLFGAILVMGLTHLVSQGLTGKPGREVVVRTVATSGALALVYVGLQLGAHLLLDAMLPRPVEPTLAMQALMALVGGAFALVTLAQALGPRLAPGQGRWLYLLAAQGAYANAYVNRRMGALRQAPARAAAAASASATPGAVPTVSPHAPSAQSPLQS